MDISSTLVGKSDQLDNIDLLTGPRDFTITGVTAGNSEQPLNIALAEFPRPWRPGLTMRRILAGIWGVDASAYVGRRVRLYRDETVTFGREKPGGTRISHASDIAEPATLTLPSAKGRTNTFTIEPLPDAPASVSPTPEQVEACDVPTVLKGWWDVASDDVKPLIVARVAELEGDPA